jgi:hypothetical protein
VKTVEIPLDLLRASHELVNEAAALVEKFAADRAAPAIKAAAVAESLIAQGIVDVMDKSTAITVLQDHDATLDYVQRLAKQAAAPRSMGQSVKSAGVPADPYARPKSESDRIFEEKLGIGG